MKYCTNCGKQLDDRIAYCPSCGRYVCGDENFSYNQHDYNSGRTNSEVNGLAVAGLVLAILMPFIGLIISIIANSNAKECNDEQSQNLSRIGIIVSVSIMVLIIVVLLGMVAFIIALAAN